MFRLMIDAFKRYNRSYMDVAEFSGRIQRGLN